MARIEEIEIAIPKNIFGDFHEQVAYEFGFQQGAEWADRTMLHKACKWLEDNLYDYAGKDDKLNIVPFDKSIFEDFKNYMTQ